MPATHCDYVTVGAGAAGCAVANRLSADPDCTVLPFFRRAEANERLNDRYHKIIVENGQAAGPEDAFKGQPATVRVDRELILSSGAVRQWANTDYHPVGSCKMGGDDLAVVDQELKVRGVDHLRVIDASIMPKLISGNTMATSTMIGEKGAHHVLHGLTPPLPTDAPA